MKGFWILVLCSLLAIGCNRSSQTQPQSLSKQDVADVFSQGIHKYHTEHVQPQLDELKTGVKSSVNGTELEDALERRFKQLQQPSTGPQLTPDDVTAAVMKALAEQAAAAKAAANAQDAEELKKLKEELARQKEEGNAQRFQEILDRLKAIEDGQGRAEKSSEEIREQLRRFQAEQEKVQQALAVAVQAGASAQEKINVTAAAVAEMHSTLQAMKADRTPTTYEIKKTITVYTRPVCYYYGPYYCSGIPCYGWCWYGP